MEEGNYRIERVRNIGFVAHIDAGKTTTTERILYFTGRTHKLGNVDEGTTEMDWMEEERQRGITITSAATTCFWRDHRINIIDTPGHVDFTAEVERSLRVLDGAIVIFSGVDMVESQSEKVWRQADKYRVPRLAFINKLDRVGAQFTQTMEMIRERLSAVPLPLQIPYGSGPDLGGMIDLVKMKLIRWDEASQGERYEYLPIPKEMEAEARAFREALLERLAEVDEGALMDFLENREFGEERLRLLIRQATLGHGYVPVLGGASLKNVGIQPLLDAIVAYLPSPLDVPPVRGIWWEGQNGDRRQGEKVRHADPNEPLAALAFKVVTDEYTGRLVFLRVYSGRLERGKALLNSTRGLKERISRIFHMHANDRTEIESAVAGDIVAVVGPRELTTGETLCDPDDPIILEKIEFPEPVLSAAIEPQMESEEKRLTEALHKLAAEDPTFKFRVDAETNQTIISGMGELHLEILIHRLTREFKVAAHVGRPEVAYKETLLEPVEIEERFVKQTGGRGQYAHVIIKFAPLERGQGFIFEEKIKGGLIPQEFIPSVRQGIEEAMQSGPLAGYPVIDIKATLVGGSFHPVDSSDLAFKTAGARALHAALRRGGATLLEPIMEVEIISPNEYLGEVVDDVKVRRGEVKAIESRNSTQILRAEVPLAETFGYATRLRSLTQGRAVYSLKFARYEPVPPARKEEILRGR
ncbi:MAG: elongation factor G [Candidatus Acetothermia bacterium]|jgi:elongation factor G|nr:elongation factor G [Candidatus Acetothermia bacterium]MDH7505555.1 elongation factor G [Candidatus Acetothermia bacterium]